MATVFISSRNLGLEDYRESAAMAAHAAHFHADMQENWTAEDRPPLDVYLERVRQADVLVVILAHRYGWVPQDEERNPEGKSITWLECEEAVANGKQVLAFVVDEGADWPDKLKDEADLKRAMDLEDDDAADALIKNTRKRIKGLKAFKQWLSSRGLQRTFRTSEDLRLEVEQALRSWRSSQAEYARTKNAALIENRIQKSFQYDVFLSHNSGDKPAVRKIGRALMERGLRPWLDEWELRPGFSWQDSISQVIAETRSVAVFIGQDGTSPWQLLEQEAILADAVKRGLPVIPVLLPGARNKPELPLFLANMAWVDLRDGLSDEGLDRLQWGITGARPAPSDDVEVEISDHDRFDIFFCFRDSDRHAVQQVSEDLEKVGITSWPDDWSISSEKSWWQLLFRRVQKIHALAVFASDEGPWIDEQVESFIWNLIENDQLVIPVILPTAKGSPTFPVYLRRKQPVDFRSSDPNPAIQLASLLSANRNVGKGSRNG